MRARGRWLLGAAAWSSTFLLMLFSTAAALSEQFWFAWVGENYRREVLSSRGVVFVRADFAPLPPGVERSRSDGLHTGWHGGRYRLSAWQKMPPWRWKPAVFQYRRRVNIELPLWMPIAATALMAALSWRAGIIRRRRPGLCPSCNYDRRGLPPTSRCPECGTT